MNTLMTDAIRAARPQPSDKFSTTLQTLILDMLQDGYKCRAPSPEVEDLDRKIIGGGRCTSCKGALYYEPFWKADTKSYRAFAVCTQCGHLREF